MIKDEDIKYIADDEIDLKELVKTIWNNRIFILVLTSIVTIISIIYAYSKTPIYEAKALIEIGNYKMHNNNNNNNNNNKITLDNSSQLVKKLNVLFIDMYKNEKDKVSFIESISVPKGTKEFIEITALSPSNELASKEILNVINYIKTEHKKVLDDVKQRRELEIKNIDFNIQNIQNVQLVEHKKSIKKQGKSILLYTKELNTINKVIKKIETSDASLTALKLMEKSSLLKMLSELELQLYNQKQAYNYLSTTTLNIELEKKNTMNSLLLPHNYKNTQIVGNIITNDYAIKPKKLLIIIVSFITGFILSIFIVFFMGFLNGFKKDEDKSV